MKNLFTIQLLIIISYCAIKAESPLSISERLTHTTVRIQTENGTGTAFFFSFFNDNENGSYVPVLVTCKHVIKGATKGQFYLTERGTNSLPKIGSYFSVAFDNFESL
ncbi:MAG: hypothetical protein WC959_11025 [Kiritimatiellales bacterium]